MLHSETFWDTEVAQWCATLDEIRALPCSHTAACSGQLRHGPNGLEAWLVCDGCEQDIRPLPDQTRDARSA